MVCMYVLYSYLKGNLMWLYCTDVTKILLELSIIDVKYVK